MKMRQCQFRVSVFNFVWNPPVKPDYVREKKQQRYPIVVKTMERVLCQLKYMFLFCSEFTFSRMKFWIVKIRGLMKIDLDKIQKAGC